MTIFIVLLVLAFLLFSREIFPLEISALLIMVALIIFDVVPKDQAFGNFGNDSLILIGSLCVLIAALNKTGVVNKLEVQLMRISGGSRTVSFVLLLVVVAFVSAFVSNTATLIVTIPVVVSVAKRFGESPKRWLMPIAFASLIGGMNTLIGTSTNIIISSLLPDYGLSEFSLFTPSAVGLPILIGGTVYLLIFSKFLISEDKYDGETTLAAKYNLRQFTAEVVIREDSPLCEEVIRKAPLFSELDVIVLGVVREGMPVMVPRGSFILRAGDRLIVEGHIERLTELMDRYNLSFVEEKKEKTDSAQEEPEPKSRKKTRAPRLHEVLVTASSRLHSRTPAEIQLRNRFRLSLIAINRQGETIREKLSTVRIHSGDILVVQFLGQEDAPANTFNSLGFVALQELDSERFLSEKAGISLVLFAGALLVGALSPLPLSVTCLAAALLCVAFGILTTTEMYNSIEWRVLLFIGAVLCLGKGMLTSGTADVLASTFSYYFAGVDPLYTLAAFLLVTVVMTQALSNQATAVVMIPLAVKTAEAVSLSPMPFVMAVTVAASCSFVTPFEPVLMLVYGPGNYKFSDFFRLGVLLLAFSIVISLFVIPQIWPLQP